MSKRPETEAERREREEIERVLERINTGMATQQDADRLGDIVRRAWDERRNERNSK